VLCADGPVTSLVELSLAVEHRRGHGVLYDGVNQGRVDVGRFRKVVASQQIPRCDNGRIVLAIDVSNWLRPDAATSPDRLFCHTYGRGKGQAQMIPGWPYSFVAALEPGRTSWTAILDAQRLGPDDGQWKDSDPEIWIVGDTGYDGPRLAFLLADLPVRLLVRMRSDRVLAFPAAPRCAGTVGRRARHGAEFTFKDSQTWPEAAHSTTTQTTRYGTAQARSWDRLHPRLTHRGVWAEHDGEIPIIEGTVIRLQVDRLPGDGTPKPLWLWFSGIGTEAADVDRLWQMFLHRFDLEHTFRFLKQTLGWTKPRIRTPAAADRWTWQPSARTPNSDWPATSSRTCAVPGRKQPPNPAGCPRAASAGGFATSDRQPPCWPAHRNPHGHAQAVHQDHGNAQRAPQHNPGKTIKTDTVVKGGKKQAA
jgi:hypothetical protein